MEEKVRWQGHTCRVLKNVKKEGEFRSLKKTMRALELVGVLRIGNGSFCRLSFIFYVIGFRRMRSLLSQPSQFATSTCSLFSFNFVWDIMRW